MTKNVKVGQIALLLNERHSDVSFFSTLHVTITLSLTQGETASSGPHYSAINLHCVAYAQPIPLSLMTLDTTN